MFELRYAMNNTLSLFEVETAFPFCPKKDSKKLRKRTYIHEYPKFKNLGINHNIIIIIIRRV